MGARSREANLQSVAIAAPSVQHGTAAAGAMSINEVVDRSDHACLRQGLPHERALPWVIFRQRPVLQRAAAADTEMFANRRAAFMARLVDMHQMAAIRMAGYRFDRDRLPGQRKWHVDRTFGRVGDTTSTITE